VPLRFSFDADQDVANLRAGMSADLSIDTGRKRSFGGLWTDLTVWARSWLDAVLPAKAAPPR
jgi:NAD-dependent SIR2 family protein deacetylase